MYKIFHENKALIFPHIEEKTIFNTQNQEQTNPKDIEKNIKHIKNWLEDSHSDLIVEDMDTDEAKNLIQHFFKMAPAAGGIVVNKDKIVVIIRNSIPDLPKGHIEKEETPEEAALREVEEETGITGLSIVKPLPCTWHCYLLRDVWMLKQTYWYVMKTEHEIHVQPQTEEGITNVKCIAKDEADAFLQGTFRSISETLGDSIRRLLH